MDRDPGHLEILKDDLHLAAVDLTAYLPERREAKADAAHHGSVGRRGAVRTKAPADLDRLAPSSYAKGPGFGVSVGEANDALMPRQVVGMLGPAMPRDLGRRAEHHGAKLAEPPRLQRRVAHLPDPHREVQALSDKIHFTIGDL